VVFTDKIVKLLGQGTFGKVVEAQAARAFNRVAIKIIRAVPKYREASAIEIRVLKALKENDPSNRLCVYYRITRCGRRRGC
jgi:dual-specificity kinase